MKDGAAEPPTIHVDFQKYRYPNEEELKFYNNCLKSAYVKVGVPFAMISYFISAAWRKKGNVHQPRSFLQNTVAFVLNSFFGTCFLIPSCYSKFSSLYKSNIKKEQEEGAAGDIPTTQLADVTLPPTSVEDFSYPTDAVTQFNDSDSNFSGDFNYSRQLEDDSDHLSAKPQTTTYSDLRARHRNEQTKRSATPGSSADVDSRKAPPSKIEEAKEPLISSRPVRKNMYGDEIE